MARDKMAEALEVLKRADESKHVRGKWSDRDGVCAMGLLIDYFMGDLTNRPLHDAAVDTAAKIVGEQKSVLFVENVISWNDDSVLNLTFKEIADKIEFKYRSVDRTL